VTVNSYDVVECTGACDYSISEYAEGSSNNKYLEIANFTGAEVALSGYALPSLANAPDTG
jgi:predicted extracellular nuclease